MTIEFAIGIALGMTTAGLLFQVLNNKHRWSEAVEHSFFEALAVGVMTLVSYHKHPYAIQAIGVAIAMTIGIFLVHAVYKRRWAVAVEQSFFAVLAIGICLLVV